jgi:Ca2+/Na+ antiporter
MKKNLPTDPEKIKIEKSLLGRLKKLGFVMLLFSACFLSYAFFVYPSPMDDGVITPQERTLSSGITNTTQEMDEEELLAEETLNFFAVSLVFAAIGIACIVIAWKRQQDIHSTFRDL